MGVNDEIMKDPAFASGGTRSVARADVARACARRRSAARRRPAWRWTWSRRRPATARRRRTRRRSSHHPRENTPTSPRRRTRRASFPQFNARPSGAWADTPPRISTRRRHGRVREPRGPRRSNRWPAQVLREAVGPAGAVPVLRIGNARRVVMEVSPATAAPRSDSAS